MYLTKEFMLGRGWQLSSYDDYTDELGEFEQFYWISPDNKLTILCVDCTENILLYQYTIREIFSNYFKN
jgi:hypothetical protein